MAKKDPTEWGKLKQAATGGYLQFDPKDAETCANACQDLITFLQSLAKAVNDNKLNQLPQFGNLYSGQELTNAFNGKGARLQDILQTHAEVDSDMHDTFVAAGKAYQNTDDSSANSFVEVSNGAQGVEKPLDGMPSHTDLPKPSLNLSSWGLDASMPDFPASLKDYKGNKDSSVTVMYENKDSLSYSDLYQLGQSIRAQPAADAAGMWKSMAGELLQKLGDLTNTINSVGDSWQGNGADAAIQATQNYQQGVQPLTDAMTAMSQNLDYTAQWLYSTALSMPHNPHADSCCPAASCPISAASSRATTSKA
jgi:uncharacterized protein YukE